METEPQTQEDYMSTEAALMPPPSVVLGPTPVYRTRSPVVSVDWKTFAIAPTSVQYTIS